MNNPTLRGTFPNLLNLISRVIKYFRYEMILMAAHFGNGDQIN